jgi:hypothetical protein
MECFITNKKVCKFIETKYNALCNTRLDINEHLPTLCNYAKECESIIEYGLRGCVSSWAFVHGLLHNERSIKNNDWVLHEVFINNGLTILKKV